MVTRIAIIGCGVVGAAIAYELSREPDLTIFVLDRQPPAQGASGAALGVLMGVISQKVKGQAWALRQTSMQRYETLIPELEAVTGQPLAWNRDGIVLLTVSGEPEQEEWQRWERLRDRRQQQGWQLQLWDELELRSRCPQIEWARVTGAVYSPSDRQIDPIALTNALVNAAQKQGVNFRFDVEVKQFKHVAENGLENTCQQLQINSGEWLEVDWVIVAAGLGSTALTRSLTQDLEQAVTQNAEQTVQAIEIRPVLGQALRLRLDRSLGRANFQPVITGEDIHLVPLGKGEYWVGATVEFPPTDANGVAWGEGVAEPARLQAVLQGAIEFCPALAEAEIVHTWSGLRPRPFQRTAPVIEKLAGFQNVILATGHYRNGVLLAPATALQVKDWILAGSG